jgi:hypothetical protein
MCQSIFQSLVCGTAAKPEDINKYALKNKTDIAITYDMYKKDNGYFSINDPKKGYDSTQIRSLYTKDNFLYLKKTWEKDGNDKNKVQKNENKKYKIQKNNENIKWSNTFIDIIGIDNNPLDMDTELYLKELFFSALVEQKATNSIRSGASSPLLNMLSISDATTKTQCIDTGNSIGWRINNLEGSSWIEFIKIILNISRMNALATLADIFGMDFNNIITFTKDPHAADKHGETHAGNAIPHSLSTENADPIICQQTEKIKGYTGNTVAAFTLFKVKNRNIPIPATVTGGQLCIGRCLPTSYLMNQNKIESQREATIIMCQDPCVGMALQKMIDSCVKYDGKFIVSTALCKELELLPWSYLHRCKVILVSALDKNSFINIDGYIEKLREVHAEVRVYNFPLLLSHPPVDLSTVCTDDLDDLERLLIEKTTVLDDVESLSGLFGKIEKEALPCEEHKKWCDKFVISKKEKQDDGEINDDIFFHVDSTSVTAKKRFFEVKWADLLQTGVIMLHAPKDTGKSLIVLSLLKGYITGEGSLGFSLKNSHGNALLLDGETPPDVLGKRMNQLGISRSDEKLFIISKQGVKGEPWRSFNLMDKEHRKALDTLITKNKIKLLVFDNITCLTETGNIYTPDTARELMTWATELSKKDVAVVFIHHTLEKGENNRNNKMRGSAEWRTRCHVEIQLINKADIPEFPQLPEIVQNMAAKDGACLGMKFNSCKYVPWVTNKIVWLHLPLDASQWQKLCVTNSEGKLLASEGGQELRSTEVEVDQVSQGQDSYEEEDAEILAMSADAQKVWKKFQHEESFTRRDVDELLDCEKTKSQEIVTELINKKKICKDGSGPSTKYIPCR